LRNPLMFAVNWRRAIAFWFCSAKTPVLSLFLYA